MYVFYPRVCCSPLIYRCQSKTVKLFSVFAPMLCKRPTKTIEMTVKEMGGTEFIIEEKLDGERMQLHKRGNEFFYCSRSVLYYTPASLLISLQQEGPQLHQDVWKTCR